MHAKCPCSADEVSNSLFSGEVADGGLESSHTSAGGHPKRRRDTSGDPLPERAHQARPLRSTAGILAMAGITEAQVDACNMRCGTGGLTPIREAVRNNFRGKVVRFCGLVPVPILRVCFERAIEFADGMLVGFTRRALHCFTNRVFCDTVRASSVAGFCLPPQKRASDST